MEGYQYGTEIFKAGEPVTNNPDVIADFLGMYDTTKIVFILDTHCAENGRFIYTGDNPESYKACSLLEVTHISTPYSAEG